MSATAQEIPDADAPRVFTVLREARRLSELSDGLSSAEIVAAYQCILLSDIRYALQCLHEYKVQEVHR